VGSLCRPSLARLQTRPPFIASVESESSGISPEPRRSLRISNKMSTRKHLTSRSRLSENSSPAQRRRRDEESEDQQSTPLPPYEPPSFPLSESQKRALDNLRVNYNGAVYRNHLEVSKKNITSAIGESTDRLTANRAKVQRAEEKAQQQEREKTATELEEEQYTHTMNKKVTDLTAKGEKAMRDLIDYSDELAMRDSIMTEVSENIAAAPIHRPAGRRTRAHSEDGDGDEENIAEDAPAADAAFLSPVELLKKAKGDYTTAYTAKSMSDR
jgi:E3 SUMO-protein ligase NSE2